MYLSGDKPTSAVSVRPLWKAPSGRADHDKGTPAFGDMAEDKTISTLDDLADVSHAKGATRRGGDQPMSRGSNA